MSNLVSAVCNELSTQSFMNVCMYVCIMYVCMYVGTFPGVLQLESSVAIPINVSAATPQMHSRAGQHTKLLCLYILYIHTLILLLYILYVLYVRTHTYLLSA